MNVAEARLDPTLDEVRFEFATTRAEFALFEANRAAAELHAALDEALGEARAHPDRWIDPVLPLTPAERAEFAERAAAADLAVRLSMSEASVRARAFDGHMLRRMLPRLWARFLDGEVSPRTPGVQPSSRAHSLMTASPHSMRRLRGMRHG